MAPRAGEARPSCGNSPAQSARTVPDEEHSDSQRLGNTHEGCGALAHLRAAGAVTLRGAKLRTFPH
jgi:hypothetical protein